MTDLQQGRCCFPITSARILLSFYRKGGAQGDRLGLICDYLQEMLPATKFRQQKR